MDGSALLAQVNELKQQISAKDERIHALEEQVRLLQLLHFGAKSEKLTTTDKQQAALFNEAEDSAFDQTDETPNETRTVKAHTRTLRPGAGRKPISPDLPREIEEYDVPEKDKVCACGTTKTYIGDDVAERARIIPAKVVVRREIRKKYVCRACEGTTNDEVGVTTAAGPKHLIPGSMADESLLAWSINEKFEYALPFYRQAKRLHAIGIPIPRATLSTLAIRCARACEPLYELLKTAILSGPVINADETPIQVLKEPGRTAQQKSWMWVFWGGAADRQSVVFQYETGRSHQVAYEFLKDYCGVLQTDDYEAYHTAVRKIRADRPNSIEHTLCWAHVRRRFVKYWEMANDREAHQILEWIRQLFDQENLRTEYSLKGFLKHRKNRAGPILDTIWKKLQDLLPQVPPHMAFGQAISYTVDNWPLLVNYLDNPHLTPSNNSAENAIRPFVVGRKNWLFSATPHGARSSAILYSLVESAKLQKLAVYEYLYYILRKLPYCENQADYEALLPFNVTNSMIKA